MRIQMTESRNFSGHWGWSADVVIVQEETAEPNGWTHVRISSVIRGSKFDHRYQLHKISVFSYALVMYIIQQNSTYQIPALPLQQMRFLWMKHRVHTCFILQILVLRFLFPFLMQYRVLDSLNRTKTRDYRAQTLVIGITFFLLPRFFNI